MCMPKAPKPDPEIKAAQERQKQAELARLADEKKKQLTVTKRGLLGGGSRSLISGTEAGFGSNY